MAAHLPPWQRQKDWCDFSDAGTSSTAHLAPRVYVHRESGVCVCAGGAVGARGQVLSFGVHARRAGTPDPPCLRLCASSTNSSVTECQDECLSAQIEELRRRVRSLKARSAALSARNAASSVRSLGPQIRRFYSSKSHGVTVGNGCAQRDEFGDTAGATATDLHGAASQLIADCSSTAVQTENIGMQIIGHLRTQRDAISKTKFLVNTSSSASLSAPGNREPGVSTDELLNATCAGRGYRIGERKESLDDNQNDSKQLNESRAPERHRNFACPINPCRCASQVQSDPLLSRVELAFRLGLDRFRR